MSPLPPDACPPVLVVEDDPVAAILLRRHVEAHGYTVDEARDGNRALEMHRANPYRIVVSDWMMPGMDGVSLCREFRSIGGHYVYFILCSARNERADRTEAFEAGVDDFLNKPVDRGELGSRLIVARRILASEDSQRRQRKQLEESARRLVESNEELDALSRKYVNLFHGLPVACFTFDEQGLVREWNRESERAFEISTEEASGRAVCELLGDDWRAQHSESLHGRCEGGTFDWSLSGPFGERHFVCSLIALHNDQGKPMGAVCANVDISARKLAERQVEEFARQVNAQKIELEAMNGQLNQLVITDELTGLANRRHFREVLKGLLAEESGRPVSLLLLDLDHFKKINDFNGHLAGDQVLRQFARVLRDSSTGDELLVRYGGEEFAVLIPDCDLDRACEAAEAYRHAVAHADLGGVRLTTSVGVSTSANGQTSLDVLVGNADAALYKAKEMGRNCVCAGETTSVSTFCYQENAEPIAF